MTLAAGGRPMLPENRLPEGPTRPSPGCPGPPLPEVESGVEGGGGGPARGVTRMSESPGHRVVTGALLDDQPDRLVRDQIGSPGMTRTCDPVMNRNRVVPDRG